MGIARFENDVLVEVTCGGVAVNFSATVAFTATPIIPATGPTWYCGGEPASGGDVDVLCVVVLRPANGGEPLECPRWLGDLICGNADQTELFDEIDWSGKEAA